jgi:hypothetical protein
MQSDADAWPDAKRDIARHLHPGRRLAGEPDTRLAFDTQQQVSTWPT